MDKAHVVHTMVEEHDKSAHNPMALGRRLVVMGENYDDLDHINAGYVEPTVKVRGGARRPGPSWCAPRCPPPPPPPPPRGPPPKNTRIF
jgi:hypothetical protein